MRRTGRRNEGSAPDSFFLAEGLWGPSVLVHRGRTAVPFLPRAVEPLTLRPGPGSCVEAPPDEPTKSTPLGTSQHVPRKRPQSLGHP